jgi:glycosyltransferase involved in cell wall biosynthesis
MWVTWEVQRRNKGMSEALQWPLYEILDDGPRLVRYVRSTWRTLRAIAREKPQVLAAQNPSVVLALLALACKRVFGYRLIVDAHNSGIHPREGASAPLMVVSRFIQRHADLTIVTNRELQGVVESNGGRAVVLPDPLPKVHPAKPFPLRGGVAIAYICTYSADEPYREAMQAAAAVPADVTVYVTGRYQGRYDGGAVPDNVVLLGFLSDEQFWSLLASVDFIMDLTLREGCLLCGAYEAVALEKPLIISDTRALRSYFSRGCVYVAPSPAAIAAGIREALGRRRSLEQEVRELKVALGASGLEGFRGLQSRITRMPDVA